MTTLVEVLEAIHTGPPALKTVRAIGRDRGDLWKMWWQAPDLVRVERDVPGGTEVKIQARPYWWISSPEHGNLSNDGDGSLIDLGPQVHTLDPRPLLATSVLEVMGEETVSGRAGATVRSHPRSPGELAYHPVDFLAPGDIAIDLERGIILRTNDIEVTEVAFDQEFSKGTFGSPFPHGVEPRRVAAEVREVGREEAVESAGFPIVVPRVLPRGARLLRSRLVSAETGPSVIFDYLVDPGGVYSLTIQQGPGLSGVALEEGWSKHEGTGLRVRELGPGAVPPGEVLIDTPAGRALVQSDLPLSLLATVASSLEPLA